VADPIAVIIRFSGDPDELFERFERARRLWIEGQDGDYDRPAFYAACKTEEGIAIVSGWETDAARKAFAHRMGPYLGAAGIRKLDHHHEHLRIEKLGWD
jgi:hypothetical protein